MANTKETLFLSFDELAKLELMANIEAHEGKAHGMHSSEYGAHERKKLDNRTVRILNKFIERIRYSSIDQTHLDVLLERGLVMCVSPTFTHERAIAERFSELFYDLVMAQILTPHGEDGVPANNPITVGYPLRNLLDAFQNHRLCEEPDLKIVEGITLDHHEEIHLWEYMVNEDEDISRCFWYFLKLTSRAV